MVYEESMKQLGITEELASHIWWYKIVPGQAGSRPMKCEYCKKIVDSKPVQAHGKPFCNYLCLNGYEAEIRMIVKTPA